MKTTYHKYTLKGEHSADAAYRALGEAAAQGLIVRMDVGGGQTQVYVASQDTGGTTPKASDAKKKPGGIQVTEVTESDLTKLG